MPNYLTGDWRIRSGTHTVLDMTADYNFKALPRQEGQRMNWWRPDDTDAPFSESAEDIQGLDGSWVGMGGINFTWTLTQLKPGQIKYLRDAFFDGGFYTDAITVMTWDRAGQEWVVVNCQAHMQNPARTAEAPGSMDGYTRVRIDFYVGLTGGVASSGNEFLFVDDTSFTFIDGSLFNWVENG